MTGKIGRMLRVLEPHTEKSNMVQKHAAMLMSGGKPITIGYNHNRSTSHGKMILSFHAEVHALSQFFDLKNCSSLRNYLNDSERCMSFKNTGVPILKGVGVI
jgi:hypothetical protein